MKCMDVHDVHEIHLLITKYRQGLYEYILDDLMG